MRRPIRTKCRVTERRHESGRQVITLIMAVNGRLQDAETGAGDGGTIRLATVDAGMAAHFLPGRTFYIDFSEV